MAEALVWSEKRAVSIDTLNSSYCRSQHAPAVLTRVACSRPAHSLRTRASSSQRPLPVGRAPSQAVSQRPCARQTRAQQGRAYRREDGGSRHRRDRLEEGGAGGAYGHQSPCPFTRHLPRTNLDTRACTLMRFPQLQGRHPLPYHANGAARPHRHVLLGLARLSPAERRRYLGTEGHESTDSYTPGIP